MGTSTSLGVVPTWVVAINAWIKFNVNLACVLLQSLFFALLQYLIVFIVCRHLLIGLDLGYAASL